MLFLENLMQCAEQNDIKSANEFLHQNENYLKSLKYASFVKDFIYPVYQLAYHLNFKEFCLNLIKKITELTGNDAESVFFDDSCNFYIIF